MPGALLHCPIRGPLTIPERAADGLTYTEEKRRIDCIRFLLAKGYPPSHFKIETVLLRFGHRGRNSFRTDLVILDVPAATVPSDEETIREHAKLIAEFKRDNANAHAAIRTQVQPALDFLQDLAALGIYWDDVEQRLFYRTMEGTRTRTHETTVAVLPPWGHAFEVARLTYRDLRTTGNLLELFKKIETRLHAEVADKSRRFEIMLQVLLAKLHDETTHQPAAEMSIQDFSDAPLSDGEVKRVFETLLGRAVRFYRRYLPNEVPATISLSGAMLRDVSALLAPVKILGSKRDVVQEFYMYFAKAVYKWDLAQYFTPSEVVDFIVSLANPRAGDTVKDPACGTGDFLISSFHYASAHGADIRDAVFGADESANAVQMCVLNMVLNGDGKGNIRREDSLVSVEREESEFAVMLCNPPFGVRIQERRFDVLRKFDLGHQWARGARGYFDKTDTVLGAQEVGILFAELCVRQCEPGGRVGIIVPNGYLGNRGPRYLALREWLIRNARVIAVVAFPRFTFKKSGADVSASVLLLEKRAAPLMSAADSDSYPFYAGLVESVGWNVANKQAVRIFKRDPLTGAYLTDENNQPVPDADFDRVLRDLWGSRVSEVFPWVTVGVDVPADLPRGWDVDFRQVASRSDLSLDPKRWSNRFLSARAEIEALPHFSLGEVFDFIPREPGGREASKLYKYIELQDTADGIVTPTLRRGWELPSRARHGASPGDIYVARIWSSMGKWFLAGGDTTDTVVSDGFHRLRLKPGKEDYLIDFLVGVNTEAYRIQGRALCTGSDGLAELGESDLLEIILPRVVDADARAAMSAIADDLLHGRTTVASVVGQMLDSGKVSTASVPARSNSWVQV